jgi:TonB family protein
MAYYHKPEKVSKLSLVISLTLHAGIITVLVFIAAREGMFGRHATRIAITMMPRERPLEKPAPVPIAKPVEKQKQPEPREPLITEASKPATAPPAVQAPAISEVAPSVPKISVAPKVAAPPVFLFGGGDSVESSSDPRVLYKGFLEYTLRSNWKRPENMNDLKWVAEVKVEVDAAGRVKGFEWEKGSGNETWDNSVRIALAQAKFLERPPPNGFPDKVLVRFDVQSETDALKP